MWCPSRATELPMSCKYAAIPASRQTRSELVNFWGFGIRPGVWGGGGWGGGDFAPGQGTEAAGPWFWTWKAAAQVSAGLAGGVSARPNRAPRPSAAGYGWWPLTA